MKVDMSPEAVTRRLDSMGELWELSVALMDSKIVRTVSVDPGTERCFMKGSIENESKLIPGQKMVLESNSPQNSFAAFFEDEGDTGYFYALDTTLDAPVLDALHVYNLSDVIDGNIPSTVQIAWSSDGLKTALIINNYVHAVFDFHSRRGYCRTGFPPITDWSKEGHEWSDTALDLFS